eukprot:4695526-Pyramimonas_sp.AAC.1
MVIEDSDSDLADEHHAAPDDADPPGLPGTGLSSDTGGDTEPPGPARKYQRAPPSLVSSSSARTRRTAA